jgi:hypothetical protein
MEDSDMAITTLGLAIAAAETADKEFDRALNAAGYKSQWDNWKADKRQIAMPITTAYLAKVEADRKMHEAFERPP